MPRLLACVLIVTINGFTPYFGDSGEVWYLPYFYTEETRIAMP